MNATPFYLSKTFWSNGILAGIYAKWPQVKEVAPPETVFVIVNLVLRVMTNSKLTIA